MGRIFKWSGIAVAALAALAVGLYLISRAMPVPQAEAQALAMIEAPRTLSGRNGFAALWALSRDVPVERAPALLDEEIRRLGTHPLPGGTDAYVPYASVLEAYPLLEPRDLSPAGRCGLREGGCLQKIRSAPDDFAGLRARSDAAARRVAALDAYDHFVGTLPARPDTPFPGYAPLMHDPTLHAQAFVDGDVDAALQGVCRDVSIGRKLAASGDNLLGAMMGAALVEGAAGLFIDMVAELPLDHPLPDVCGRAFSETPPMTAAVCPTMLGEGRYTTGNLRALNAAPDMPWRTAWFLDTDKTAARAAPRIAWFCSEEADASIRLDRPLRNPVPPPSPWSLHCIANAAGCILADVAAPAYDGHALRLQDADMQLKLAGTWLWLRAQTDDTRPLAQRLAARPASLKSQAREVRIDAARRTLSVAMYDTRSGRDRWELPIPAWMTGEIRAP